MNEPTRPAAFKALLRARGRATLICFFILLALLTANLLLLSTFSDVGSQPLVADTPITIAVAVAAATILLGALITIAYIVWANFKLDRLTELAIAELDQQSKTT